MLIVIFARLAKSVSGEDANRNITIKNLAAARRDVGLCSALRRA